MMQSKTKEQIPKTETELAEWMKAHCFNFHNYAINGNVIHEGFGIERLAKRFSWYFTERGQKENLKFFQTEKEIVEYAYHAIKGDKWAKTHCIGFTTDKTKSAELASLLVYRNIEYIQDEIPYYEPQRPVYRTFVFGCDVNKVGDLKEKILSGTVG